MLPEELAMVDSTIDAYKAALLKVGSLKRLTIAQRQQIAQAHSIVFGLVSQLHGPKPMLAYADNKDGQAQAWRQVAYTLRQVDPLWHTRGGAGTAAAQQAVARLVDPEACPWVAGLQPCLRELVLRYFRETEREPVRTREYFAYLANRDIYKE